MMSMNLEKTQAKIKKRNEAQMGGIKTMVYSLKASENVQTQPKK